MTRVLIVEDDADLLETLRKLLERAGNEVLTASNGAKASQLLDTAAVDLMVTDLVMPEADGLSLIQNARQRHPEVRIVAISGGASFRPEAYLSVARRLGADAAFAKPLPVQEFLDAVRDLAPHGDAAD